MILVDYKKGHSKSDPDRNIPLEFVGHLKRLGLSAELADLPYGDFAFEGNGPEGPVMIGIERKSLHDMLSCIEDARFASHQRIGMKHMYAVSALILEGHWRPHDPQGILMEGFNSGTSWGYCKRGGYGRTMYHKVYRYLISIALSGVIVTYSRDVFHTAYNVHEWFHYFQKRWSDHDALQEFQKISPPALLFKPNLVRRWAFNLTDVGTKGAELAARHFKTPIKLATADEMEWLRIPGIGVKTARQIVEEVHGV